MVHKTQELESLRSTAHESERIPSLHLTPLPSKSSGQSLLDMDQHVLHSIVRIQLTISALFEFFLSRLLCRATGNTARAGRLYEGSPNEIYWRRMCTKVAKAFYVSLQPCQTYYSLPSGRPRRGPLLAPAPVSSPPSSFPDSVEASIIALWR